MGAVRRKESMMEAREALARAPLFSSVKGDVLDILARSAKVRQFAPGELLVKEGEDAVAFYVLCEGEAEVVKRLGQEGEQVVGHLSEGDFFGEMALLDGFPRSASVRAVSDCECLLLARWDFLALVRTSPEVPLAILPVLSRRLRECEEQLLP
jgi:CRP/FNR family cyclic AMP-dependent transcriptional regulator